ncbi:hypothetical protein RB653_007536 [Dictyostelium firmibasis]|uniref:GH18 domain-containing protein n=1 Tax=Dictyostelium firmibasis TaxID=79012 RepID=A0AAN7YM41_9MYCE
MTLHLPFIDVSINAQWSDWEHYPNGRPNPLYSQQVLDYNVDGLVFGFVTLATNGEPCWAAQPTMGMDWALPLAKDIQPSNKKVVISFGGASNQDISIQYSVEKLIETYGKFIDMYQAYGLDFDLENGLFNDKNIALALKSVKSKYPNLVISLTLPTLPTGLTATGLSSVNAFKDQGFDFVVNGMAMDYYDEQWKEKMGDAAIQASTSIKDQLKTLYTSLSDSQLYGKVAITPMIGLNDDLSMFTIDDAASVSKFAKSNQMSFTASWDLNRDNPSSFSYVDLQTSSNPDQKESGEYSITFVTSK